MGWLFTQGQTRSELIANRNNPWETATHKGTTLAFSTRGNVLWAIRTVTEKSSNKLDMYIACDLLGGKRGYGWGYKDMDESCGPCYYTCPLKYFALVSCPDSGYAIEWRKKVMDYHKRMNRKFILNQKVSLVGCKIKEVILTCLKPLKGIDEAGVVYRIPKKLIA